MRASLATTGTAWALLAGLAAVFVQLAQTQGSSQALTLARYSVIQWSYWVFDGAVVISVLAVAAGGVPLWLRMFRDARGARRPRELACLLAPVAVPAAYLAASAAIAGLVRQPAARVVPWQPRPVADLANGMIGPWWFLALVVAGLAAAVVSAAGPGLAPRRLRPDGPAVVLAARAAGLAAAAMGLAGAASIVAAVGLYLWAPTDAGQALVGGRPYQSLRRPLTLLGSLLDASALQPGRTGRNHLRWLARSQGLPDRRADAVLAQVGLEKAARRKAGGYSLGMRHAACGSGSGSPRRCSATRRS